MKKKTMIPIVFLDTKVGIALIDKHCKDFLKENNLKLSLKYNKGIINIIMEKRNDKTKKIQIRKN